MLRSRRRPTPRRRRPQPDPPHRSDPTNGPSTGVTIDDPANRASIHGDRCRRAFDALGRIRDGVCRRRGSRGPGLSPLTLQAVLYDARGDDRAIDLDAGETVRFDRDRLLWIDL